MLIITDAPAGSSNFYGWFGGWVHSAETTPKDPKHINCGFLAFTTPAPQTFVAAIEERIAERIRKNVMLFSADQDVVNMALQRTGEEQYAVHTDWYANYRPNSEATLKRWHVVHWLGLTKPWGLKGHTRGEIRYNDRTLPQDEPLFTPYSIHTVFHSQVQRPHAAAAGRAVGSVT